MLLALGAFLAAPASAAPKLKVYFTRDTRLQTVERPLAAGADPIEAAVRALFVGPRATERRDGIRTAIPRGVGMTELQVVNGAVFIRVPETFAAGGGGGVLELRLAQVVYTVTQTPGVGAVRILLGDEPMPVPGEDPGAVLTRAALPPVEIIGPVPVTIRQVQDRLVQMRYLPKGAATGRLDYRTSQALLAFQASEGLSRTGDANLDTRRRITIAKTPTPHVASQSRRVEVNRYKGVALLIEHGVVQRVVHVSTGAGGRTPRGTFRVIRKELRSWSNPFKVWLPYASYIVGGIAFHQYPSVPAYSASHGCIRIGYPEAPLVYAFATMGTVVQVT